MTTDDTPTRELTPWQNELFETEFKSLNNVYITKGLFFETSLPGERSKCKYTLKDFDWNNYKSLYKCYMDMEDPSEYLFATTYFDSWQHWMQVVDSNWFTEHIFRWRKELEVKIRAKALYNIQQEAQGGKQAYNASKFLLEGKWQTEKHNLKRGRPKKEEIIKQAEDISRQTEDLKRLGIN